MNRLKSIRNLIIDMDGVLYLGDKPLPGLDTFFAFIREQGLCFQLVTNNATLTPEMYVLKMARMGVTIQESDVLTSAIGTADYLSGRFPRGSRIYAICEEGMHDALQRAGFILSRRDPVAVVVSFDRDITYAKLREATLLIRSGVPFIASNPDRTLPVPEGQVPGTGTIVAAVEAATDQKPFIVGKPETFLMEQAIKRMGATPQTTAAVGDRPETDILSAQRAGLLSILTLSGATDRARLAASDIKPDIVLDDIQALVAGWKQVLAQ
ncbi:MAG: HAD-IIA family hydrolase [Anaerolineae bacterium]|nr:HAD-IIA family hydrolase [Anaerolineae bacterium]